MTETVERFETEEAAREAAIVKSRLWPQGAVVVESPRLANGEPDPKRFCVDDSSFVRSWERFVAAYDNGREVKS